MSLAYPALRVQVLPKHLSPLREAGRRILMRNVRIALQADGIRVYSSLPTAWTD